MYTDKMNIAVSEHFWRLINVALSFFVVYTFKHAVRRSDSNEQQNHVRKMFLAKTFVYLVDIYLENRVCWIRFGGRKKKWANRHWIMVVVSCLKYIDHYTSMVKRWTPGEVNYVCIKYDKASGMRQRERERCEIRMKTLQRCMWWKKRMAKHSIRCR